MDKGLCCYGRSSPQFGTPLALSTSKAVEGLEVLRITIQNSSEAFEMKLEGRVAGPWAGELNRAWLESAPQLASKKVIIDLNNVTYADAAGKQVLRAIYGETHADLITSSPWTQFLAEEVTAKQQAIAVQEGE